MSVQGVEMELSELHLAYVRRVQKELEELLQFKVQRSAGKYGSRTFDEAQCERKQRVVTEIVKVLVQSERG